MEQSKDLQGLVQRDLDAAEKKASEQAKATQEDEQKIALLQRDGEETPTQLAEAQQYCRSLEAAAKGMCFIFLSSV
jgi:hypothetical protein